MKNFYMLYPDQSGLNGVPVYLNARLWETIEKNNLMAPIKKYYEWDKYEYKKENFPNKLYLIIQAPKISFDYYPYRSGVIVSIDFLEIIEKYTNDMSYVLLEVYSNKMKKITKKDYFFLKFNSYLINGLDYKESIYTINKTDAGEEIFINNRPWIENIEKIVLHDEEIMENIFCLHGWIFFNKPFISKKLLNEFINKKIYGIKYVETNSIVKYSKTINVALRINI